MRQPDDQVLLKDMADHARRAVDACSGRSRLDLDTDLVLAAALERFIEIIGEAASRVSAHTRDSRPEIPWIEIVGMRNRLVHGYASVDHDVLWAVVTRDLPALIPAIEEKAR